MTPARAAHVCATCGMPRFTTATMFTIEPGDFALAPLAGGALHHVPGAVEIRVDDREPALDAEVDGRLRKLPAAVVDQHIQPPEALPDLRHQRVHLLRIADGHRTASSLPCRRACGFPSAVSASFSARRPQMTTFAPRRARTIGDAAADAAAAARNHAHLVLRAGRPGRREVPWPAAHRSGPSPSGVPGGGRAFWSCRSWHLGSFTSAPAL